MQLPGSRGFLFDNKVTKCKGLMSIGAENSVKTMAFFIENSVFIYCLAESATK